MLAIQAGSTIQIRGISFDEMKDKYIGSEFGKVWEQAVSTTDPCNYLIPDGLLYFRHRLCVLPSHREAILHDAHDALTGGHIGMNTTLEKVERFFYWPKMRKDVFCYVTKCAVCQKVKASRGKPAGL